MSKKTKNIIKAMQLSFVVLRLPDVGSTAAEDFCVVRI
jgi:hypothetical protein